ncbi:putative alanine aminotransferase, mitochondrial [Exophiala dermatitidis]
MRPFQPLRASAVLLRAQRLSSDLATACKSVATTASCSSFSSSLPAHSRVPRSSTRLNLPPGRRNMSSTPRLRSLHVDNINPNVKNARYAVRGELAIKSEEYRHQLMHGDPPTPPESPLPFDSVVTANIGNPQQLDQKPITFFREVLALLEYPALLDNEEALKSSFGYKQDAIDRARWLLKQVGSVGAYSQSAGVPGIRQSVANFIERRDGFPAVKDDIYLCAGASSGVNTLFNIICAGPKTGVLVPIPQYPLYTATLAIMNARCVPYYLKESHAWGTDIAIIKKAYDQAVSEGTDVRAIVIINPGNPTGASLSEDDVEDVIKFAAEKNLVIIADEVYQTNVFIGKFHSFKRALRTMQQREPGKYDTVELASLHSVSKGVVGECGHRGGYFELVGFDPEVEDEIYKFISIQLCPPVIGQCLVELMVNPPKPGDPSFELYDKEYNGIKNGLKDRATALYEAFKQMEGVEVGEPQGAMYLFPTIHLPPKACEAAKKANRNPDEFYCLRLLDATGICVVPGSGFGQEPGTLHFRTTFLAPGTDWVSRWTKFHKEFMDQYR